MIPGVIPYLAVRISTWNCLAPLAAVCFRSACVTAVLTVLPISSPSLECPEASVRVVFPSIQAAITVPSVPEPVAISSE